MRRAVDSGPAEVTLEVGEDSKASADSRPRARPPGAGMPRKESYAWFSRSPGESSRIRIPVTAEFRHHSGLDDPFRSLRRPDHVAGDTPAGVRTRRAGR